MVKKEAYLLLFHSSIVVSLSFECAYLRKKGEDAET